MTMQKPLGRYCRSFKMTVLAQQCSTVDQATFKQEKK